MYERFRAGCRFLELAWLSAISKLAERKSKGLVSRGRRLPGAFLDFEQASAQGDRNGVSPIIGL